MKVKKNLPGMTLIEVVIATGVFAFTFLGVTMCLAAALKLNNRNYRRQEELGVQQQVIEEHQAAGVALRTGHGIKGDTMVFGHPGAFSMVTGSGSVDGITQFHAIKTEEHGDDYNFELKGLASDKNPLGTSALTIDPAQGKFGLNIINNTTENIDVTIEVSGGSFYQNDYNKGFKSHSGVYARTISGMSEHTAWDGSHVLPNELLVGYYNDAISGAEININISKSSGDITFPVSTTSLSANGKLTLKVNDTGTPETSWG